MRILGLSCCIALVVACARPDRDAATDSAAGATQTASTSAISLGELAGRWNFTATPVSGDTTRTRYVLTATGDTTGWTISFPNRDPIPTRVVAVGADSIELVAGPYESVRRRGVQVTTHSIVRRDGDRLVGVTHASYATAGADTALTLRTEGTRAP